MDIQTLDYYFPFIVLFYGLMIYVATSIPALLKIGEDRMPPQFIQQLKAHRGLGIVCLLVGSLWSLQHLLI